MGVGIAHVFAALGEPVVVVEADAARAGIEVMQALWRTLRVIDEEELRAAQEAQDALAAQRIIRKALLAADG